jgi:hypothetical protein
VLVGIVYLECSALLGSSESLIELVGQSYGLYCFLQTKLGSFSCAFSLQISSDRLKFSCGFPQLPFTVKFVKSSVAARVSAWWKSFQGLRNVDSKEKIGFTDQPWSSHASSVVKDLRHNDQLSEGFLLKNRYCFRLLAPFVKVNSA